jgi:transposase
MRTKGSPEELEHRRQLAVRRYLEGYSSDEIAAFLDVTPRTVWRWLARFHEQGPEGLASRPVPGRPSKLTTTQEKVVRRWLIEDPMEHGFATAL